MDFSLIPGTEALGQPRLGSVYDETGTPASGYEEKGPYHCEDCVHKTAMDEPFCIHPQVIGDERLQDKLVQINGRLVVKINMEHGCCTYVRQECEETGEDHGEGE